MSSGGKRLTILGLGAILIALLTSTVSLILYRSSGDIYLDRSRPGFLPEESEIESSVDESFKVIEYGQVDKDFVNTFIDEYKKQIEYLDSFSNSFSEEVLSDESLGFPTE